MTSSIIPDLSILEWELNKIKMQVFTRTNAAFLGSLMCSHLFHWVEPGHPIDTAATDGANIWWNKQDFVRCDLTEKECTLLHELWHTGLLHGPRQGKRDPKLWNIACDYRINNNLILNGHKLPDNGWWVFDPSLDKDGLLCEEEIYDLLLRDGGRIPKNTRPDLIINLTPEQTSAILGMVVQAVQAAEMAKQAGALPGNLKQVLNKFLEPVIDWRAVLNQFMTDLMDEGDYTWSRPSRRHEIYMPSIQKEEGNLDMELVYFQDTSGSISEEDMIRFNSEVRYVKEVLQPEKLTLVQFDMEIAYTKTFLKDEPFEDIEMHGGGGTDLHPVWEWIEKNRPKAAIIFSDLFCDPMRPLTVPVPVIWAVVHNEGAIVPFGKLIHIID